MAYRFKLSEPFDAGMRRIGRQQIDRALAGLDAALDPAVAVHDTRKGLKRLRALLRLGRPGLDEKVFAAENHCYRDIGRLLAAPRDRHVLLETSARLEELASGRARSAFTVARTRLNAANGGAGAPVEPHIIEHALRDLRDARQRMEALAFNATGYEVAFDGVQHSYRQAIRAFELARDSADAEVIHEWRKRVQNHWRHMMLLSPAWPELFKARIVTTRQLSMGLGEDHDIAMFMNALADDALGLSATQQRAIQSVAQSRQTTLRRQSHALGKLLFAEKPGIFRNRMRSYWNAAQESASETAN